MAAVRGALIIVLVGFVVYGLYLRIPEILDGGPVGTLPASVVTAFESHQSGAVVTYRGKNGKTVLGLLELASEVELGQPRPAEGVAQAAANDDEQVLSINGVQAGPGQYWEYAVDGFVQHVHPGKFVTAGNSRITWTLRR